MRKLLLGAGAGFSADRIEPAVHLATTVDLDYLIFECLGERTIALAQQARRQDDRSGYDPLLESRLRAVLPVCVPKGTRIVTNMGAANPLEAARMAARTARECGFAGLRIAAVCGDDVLAHFRDGQFTVDPDDLVAGPVVSANAYIGASAIVSALEAGADIVITGRAADPALYLGPQMHEFGWRNDDWERLGRGTLVGHLLECGAQVSGGYFADPGYKDVARLAEIGFPYVEVDMDGNAIIGKAPGSGGIVSEATCKEQVLYEIHDPSRYIQPDVVADFSSVRLEQVAPDRVRVSGATGHPRTGRLKVSVGYEGSFVGEGQISYAGPGAVARGRLAQEIILVRLSDRGIARDDLRTELIGVEAIFGSASTRGEPAEVRLRVVARTAGPAEAASIGHEVEALYLNGPAGGGGATSSVKRQLCIASAYIPEGAVATTVEMFTA